MGTTFQGFAVAPRRDRLYPRTMNSAGLQEGAACVYDTGNGVKAPTGAAVKGFAGLLADVQGSTGTISGTDANMQRTGIGMGLLQATQTVVVGTRLVIAGTDGSLRPFNDGVDANCDIVGESESQLTAGAQNTAIAVNLDKFTSVP